MPETQIGLAFIYGLAKPLDGAIMTVDFAGDPYSASVLPIYKSLRLSHNLSSSRVADTFGKTVGVIVGGEETVECTFEFMPSGSTRVNAALGAHFPAAAVVTLANLPTTAVGNFTNVFNSSAWIYLGGGSINGEREDAWSATLPLVRFLGLGATPTVVVG